MFGSDKDIVIQCNFCGIEINRFKNHIMPVGLFNKPFKVICRECENKREKNLMKLYKIIKRMIEEIEV